MAYLLNRNNNRKVFILGILIFIFAKLYLIVPVATSLASLRTGDDAMVYLWKGQLILKKNPSDFKALKDIETQAKLPEGNNNNIALIRSNIFGRTMPSIYPYPTYSILMAAALKISPNLVWAYEITEIVGLLLMTCGLSWFLYEVAGYTAAGLAMIPLAFAILPGQGINVFIPSNMALSCFLMLWAYLWRNKKKINIKLIGIYVFLTLGLHPISKVYLVLTPAFYWVRLKYLGGWRSKEMIKLMVALCLPLILNTCLTKIFPILNLSPLALKGNINIVNGLSYNFAASYKQITETFLIQNILWVSLVSWGILTIGMKVLNYPVNYLLIGTVFLLIISLTFILPGFPAELFNRIWVLLFIVGSLIGVKFLLYSQNLLITLSKYTISIILLILTVSWWIVKYVPDSMNNRPEIFNESVLKKNIEAIPHGSTIIFPETYITMQIALLLGSEKFGTIAVPMLKDEKQLNQLMSEKKPNIIIMPPDKNLNSLYKANAKKFIKRRQGLNSIYIKEFEILRTNGKNLNKIFLKFDNIENKKINISWEALSKKEKILSLGNINIFGEVTQIDLPEETTILRVTLPEIPFWLVGIRGEPFNQSKIHWPWNEGWQLNYKLRYKDKPKIVVDFKVLNLLKNLSAENLNPYVKESNQIISDDSGFIFLRTIFD